MDNIRRNGVSWSQAAESICDFAHGRASRPRLNVGATQASFGSRTLAWTAGTCLHKIYISPSGIAA